MNCKRLIQLSLVANLALALGWLLAGWSEVEPLSDAPSPDIPAANVETSENIVPFHWSQIESTDVSTFTSNLRAIQCPEQTILDILIAEANRLTASQSSSPPTAPDDSPREWALDFLPPEKREAVSGMLSRYAQAERALAVVDDDGIHIDRDRLHTLHEQKEADLGQFLSPDELNECRWRNEPLAEKLRGNLPGFEASEAELRELFEVLRTESLAMNDGGVPWEQWLSVNHRVAKLFGAQRTTALWRALDEKFQNLSRLAQEFGVAQESVIALYDQNAGLQKSISVNSEPHIGRLAALQQELADTARKTLGSAAYETLVARGWEQFLGN